MTREDVKELLPIMQAYSEGKTIEVLSMSITGAKWTEIYEPDFVLSSNKYRIKPEPKYRPFKNKEECWQEMLKHYPLGWIKHIDSQIYENCGYVGKEGIEIASYENVYKYYTFADGTPFGIKEE